MGEAREKPINRVFTELVARLNLGLRPSVFERYVNTHMNALQANVTAANQHSQVKLEQLEYMLGFDTKNTESKNFSNIDNLLNPNTNANTGQSESIENHLNTIFNLQAYLAILLSYQFNLDNKITSLKQKQPAADFSDEIGRLSKRLQLISDYANLITSKSYELKDAITTLPQTTNEPLFIATSGPYYWGYKEAQRGDARPTKQDLSNNSDYDEQNDIDEYYAGFDDGTAVRNKNIGKNTKISQNSTQTRDVQTLYNEQLAAEQRWLKQVEAANERQQQQLQQQQQQQQQQLQQKLQQQQKLQLQQQQRQQQQEQLAKYSNDINSAIAKVIEAYPKQNAGWRYKTRRSIQIDALVFAKGTITDPAEKMAIVLAVYDSLKSEKNTFSSEKWRFFSGGKSKLEDALTANFINNTELTGNNIAAIQESKIANLKSSLTTHLNPNKKSSNEIELLCGHITTKSLNQIQTQSTASNKNK